MFDFCGERKTGEPGEKPSESDWDQPITAHVRAQDWTRVGPMVWDADDDHWANLTSLKKLNTWGVWDIYSIL